MEEVQAPIHINRKSGYWKALKVRWRKVGSNAAGMAKPQFYQIAPTGLAVRFSTHHFFNANTIPLQVSFTEQIL